MSSDDCQIVVRDVSPTRLICETEGCPCANQGDTLTIGHYGACDPCNWADPATHSDPDTARREAERLHRQPS